MRRLRRTHKTAKIAASIKELSPKMFPRSGQKGRTSHEQLDCHSHSQSNGSTHIFSLFMEQLNHMANSLQIPLSSPGGAVLCSQVSKISFKLTSAL